MRAAIIVVHPRLLDGRDFVRVMFNIKSALVRMVGREEGGLEVVLESVSSSILAVWLRARL